MKAADLRRSCIPLLLWLCCLFSSFQLFAQAEDSTLLPNGHYIYQYAALCREYMSDGRYDTCLTLSDTILKYRPASTTAYLLKANVFLKEHLWNECVDCGHQAAKISPNSTNAYFAIFYGSMQVGRLQEATEAEQAISRLMPKDPYNKLRKLQLRKQLIQLALSRLFTGILMAMLGILIYLLYTRKNVKMTLPGQAFKRMWPLEVIFIPSTITLIGYALFYHFSAFIWSQNIHYPTQDYNPFIIRDFIFDHDGIEGYTLYLMFLVIVFFSAISLVWIGRIKTKTFYYLVLSATGLSTLLLMVHIGFYPPSADLADAPLLLLPVPLLFAGLVWWLTTLATKHPRSGFAIMAAALAVMFFIPYAPISEYDYGYILSPALRLYHGAHIPDVYFQYDLYMSLMALAFMKLGIDAYNLVWVARIGYYIFFIILFLFAKRTFHDKKLAYLLIAFDILIRYYANMDPVGYFQITPWRIDLWLVLLCLVYWQGAYHWSVGVFLGLLIIFHRNFGFIYLGAYAQLIIALPLIDYMHSSKQSFFPTVIKALRSSMVNVSILIVALVCSYSLLGGMLPSSALAYQKIGIGMIRIQSNSFYWYAAVLLGAIVILLLRYREQLSERYFTSYIFLVLLTIGNSMYFFGRSHEHNILNLAGTLSLCLFMLLDLMSISIREAQITDRLRSILNISTTLIPIVSIGLAVFCYMGSMGWKFQHQFKYVTDKNVTYRPVLNYDFDELQKLTNNSSKVFFLEFERDFLYYYKGGYKPIGYFNPNDAWVLKKDMVVMMQNLLDSGYYIAVTDYNFADEFLSMLDYDHHIAHGKCSIYYKSTTKPATQDSNVIFTRSFQDTIPEEGVKTTILNAPQEYIVTCSFATDTHQHRPNAVIFSNLHTTLDSSGMALTVDSTGGQVVFTWGIGPSLIRTSQLSIRRGQTNNFKAFIKPGSATIYINGEKAWEGMHSGKVANSDRPFMIGNSEKEDARLDGYVYKVEVIKGPELD